MSRRVMYMHTLEGRPANFVLFEGGLPYFYFVSGGHPATLVPTLRQIRREQREAMNAAATSTNESHWANPKLYGYVRVEVPE